MPDDPNVPSAPGEPDPWRAQPAPEPPTPSWPWDPPAGPPPGHQGRGGGEQAGQAEQPYGPPPYGQAGPQGAPPPYGPQGPYGYPYSWPYTPAPPARPPLSADQRRRRTRKGFAFAGVLILAVGAGIGIGAAIAPTSPATLAKGLVSKSIAAATNAGSYRYVELSTLVGTPDNISGDALAHGGRQVITQKCKSGVNVFDLRLVHGVVYFRGNTAAVEDQLGVPTSKVASTVDRWVKVVKGNTPYRTFADGITTSSNISQLRTTIVATGTRTISGSSPPITEVVGHLYAGKKKPPIGTAVLDVTSSGNLPRSLRGSASGTSGHYTLTWSFSHFGEKLHVGVPSGAIAYSALHATPPPKGTCL